MKKVNRYKISWAFGANRDMSIDFGLFPAHENNTIEVDKKFWKKYVEVRFQFEIKQKSKIITKAGDFKLIQPSADPGYLVSLPAAYVYPLPALHQF